MMQKIQRFGGAMFTPVLLFTFAGIVLAISIMMTNPLIVGGIAEPGTFWTQIWTMIENGGWTVFNQMELLFVVGLPLGLAKQANGRAAMESLITYLTFNYFINSILTFWGKTFGVNFAIDISKQSAGTGLKMIASTKTLDTSILGAIVISAIVVWIHNRYFEKKLPEFLGVFQGSAFVVIIGFVVMIPMAFLTCLVWPNVQRGISSMQYFMIHSGFIGVWIYAFLERVLIPTGLHHFVYIPFTLGDAVAPGGTIKYWLQHLGEFSQSTKPLKELFPQGGFDLFGNDKIFPPVGIAAAFYVTAKKEKRKKVLALLIPAALTAILAGITEPFEFTFLFVAPVLFIIHAILCATMETTMYLFGVVGDMGDGLISLASKNWLPLFRNYWPTYLTQIIIGLIFIVIYFILFRYLILKFNLPTPGREADDEEAKLYSKADYKKKVGDGGEKTSGDANGYTEAAAIYLDALGGFDNIQDVTNCATRLRVTVKDEHLVQPDGAFKAGGAHGVVRHGKAFQVIVGLSVPQVREAFESLIKEGIK
ncbi:alpha-glucoside-specific PTS transporter subunit IIBC [Sporolactobacillus shoreicorticis]|uniref:Alpha-glucoside-specific PTS transporter subunit IIBC n=1 Tax=Sporolactobacillus shoreicorticis TaxID=1923877 RepID=A0ABW5S3I3_9BACL|nr:alpha-glucoside-specific PTS transporter subunit IIBC [Sporolactobacillus shoreicorticis]MCO7124399.1 alpha-glucoside-specific PTS transporter subunit IIBC [Sporolactobacillus shoreicorticis]